MGLGNDVGHLVEIVTDLTTRMGGLEAKVTKLHEEVNSLLTGVERVSVP